MKKITLYIFSVIALSACTKVINIDLNSSNEQIKITVRFLSNELRSDSLNIIAHKKICDSSGACSVVKMNDNFINQIKDSIITSARQIKIEESKKK